MTTCSSCGAQVPDGVRFCTGCGKPVGAAQQPAPAQPAQPAYQAPPQPAYQPMPAYAPPAAPVEPRPAKGSVYEPISTIGFIGYFILFAIPILGQVLCIIWAFGKKEGGNANRRALARATFIMLLVGFVMGVAGGITASTAIKKAGNAAGLEGGLFSWFGQGQKTEDPSNSTNEGGDPFGSGEGGNNEGGSNEGGAQDPGEYNFNEGTVFTAEWPNNEFTKQVPKPSFAVAMGSVTDTEFVAVNTGATVQQARDYAKQLQRAGFKRDASTTDEAAFGFVTYSYKAANNKGYEAEIAFGSGMGVNAVTLTIRKLPPTA